MDRTNHSEETKTEAILSCIRHLYSGAHGGICEEMANRAETELAAIMEENDELRKAVAAKDEALEQAGAAICYHICKPFIEAGGMCVPVHETIKAALSSTPSGMVCVSKELGPVLNRVARLLWGEDKYWPNVIAELAALIGGE